MTLVVNNNDHRAFAACKPQWQRFQTALIRPTQQVSKADQERHPYQRQYAHVYHQRLATLGPACWKAVIATNAADDIVRVDRILELAENVTSIAVGTLVKAAEGDGGEALHPQSECRSTDTLYLEDDSGRVALSAKDHHNYPTGAVMAVQGMVGTDGVFQVEKFIPPATCKRVDPQPTTPNDKESSSPMLLLLSGLHCGDPNVSSLPRDMLIAYLEGRLGVGTAKRVCRVILAGGLVAGSLTTAVRELDGFCGAIASCGIPLDILPGQNDPTTANWPQRPLHKCLLKRTFASSRAAPLVRCTPNPYAVTLTTETRVIGTDGLNIQDLCKRVLVSTDEDKKPAADGEEKDHSSLEPISELEAMEKTLEWQHLCPTGPDTIPTAPHVDSDPMILTDKLCPRLYVCANATKFATATTQVNNEQLVRLVSVPKFSETGEAVLVDLETMKIELLRFQE